MSLTLVKVRARTRGKNPQTFEYSGYGKLVPRKVMGKDGKPLLVEGKEVEIDDLDTTGAVEESQLQEVLDLFDGKLVKLLEAGLDQINSNNRDKASPAAEAPEDELTPYIDAMIEADTLKSEHVAVYRRNLTTSISMFPDIFSTKMIAMAATPAYKAAVKAGKILADGSLPTAAVTV